MGPTPLHLRLEFRRPKTAYKQKQSGMTQTRSVSWTSRRWPSLLRRIFLVRHHLLQRCRHAFRARLTLLRFDNLHHVFPLVCKREPIKKYFCFRMFRENGRKKFWSMDDAVDAIHYQGSISIAKFLGRCFPSLIFEVGRKFEADSGPRVINRCSSDGLPWRAGVNAPTARHSR